MEDYTFETLKYIKDKYYWELQLPEFQDQTTLKRCFEVYENIVKQFQAIQQKMFLKFPYFQQVKIANIQLYKADDKHPQYNQDQNQQQSRIFVRYYYQELTQEIIYIDEQSDLIQCQVRKAFPLKQQNIQEMDSNLIKNLNQCLIESFHWAANFGYIICLYEVLYGSKSRLNFDSKNLGARHHHLFANFQIFYLLHYFSRLCRLQSYVQIQGNSLIEFSIFFNRFIQSSYLFYQISREYKEIWPLKQQDEDREMYDMILKTPQDYVKPKDSLSAEFTNTKELNQIGCDRLFSYESVRKKMWRYNFRYSLLLYCMSDPEFKALFLKYKEQDSVIVQEKLLNNSTDQNKQQSFKQSENLYNYFTSLDKIQVKNGFGLDVLSSFGKKLQQFQKDYSQQNENIGKEFGKFCRPDWKNIPINMRFNFKSLSSVKSATVEYYQSPHQFKIFSMIPQSNIIYQAATQSSVPEQQQQKSLFVPFKIELLESKLCYIFKTTISEIVFSIDTADDIMFLINMIQREDGSTNLYVDEQRKLTLYTTIVQGQHIEIMPAVIKVLDIHTIYFYLLLDFHAKNIALGRSTRELKYQSFVREIQHYVADYENDFQQIMKEINNSDIWF